MFDKNRRKKENERDRMNKKISEKNYKLGNLINK